MHYTEIDPAATVQDAPFDLEDENIHGHRPILLTGFGVLDSSDLLVPVDDTSPESRILALTEDQGRQALVALAGQIGKEEAVQLIQEGA